MLSGVTTVFSQDKKNDTSDLSCQSFLDKAETFHRNSSYSQAIENYIKVKECIGNEKYSPLYVQACIGLGNIYNDVYDTYEAVNQFKEGINHQIIFKTIDPIPQMHVRDGIGRTLINEGEYESAIGLIDLSVKIAALNDDKTFEIESLNNLIYLLALQDNVKEADKHLSSLNELTKNFKTPEKLTSLIKISRLAIEVSKDLNNAKKEISIFELDTLRPLKLTAKERFLRLKHQVDIKEAGKSKVLESYATWDDFKDSIQIDFYKNLKDSLLIRSQKRVIDEELQQLRIQEQLNQDEINYKNKGILYLVFLIIAFLLIIALIYYFFKKIKRQKIRIESLQKELHHRVKNNLSIIDAFIEVTKEEFEDDKFTNKLTELQNRIDSINEVHQQLYLKEDVTNLNLKKYINTLSNNVSSSFSNHTITINSSLNDDIKVKTDQSFNIGLIINEFLTNSFKYAFDDNKGVVQIEFKEGTNDYHLKLSDNGKGLPENFDINETDSFGLRIIQLLSKQLNGNFELKNNNGVILNITFPK